MRIQTIQTLSLALALALTLGLSGCGAPGSTGSSGSASLPSSGSAAPDSAQDSDSTGAAPSSEKTPESADGSAGSGFPSEAWLEFQVEGESETVRAELYEGEGYILYLPEGGWDQSAQDGADLFHPLSNEEVLLKVRPAGQTFDQAAETLLAEGWLQSDDDDAVFGRVEEGRAEVIRLAGPEDAAWYLGWSYPDQSEYYEGWGSRLPTIADTFQLVH